ncbi:MAG: hypothetical protein NTY81_03260 [Candidatus Staskawiczbacteria bacterium]|nr:hypothetical protein [Candidatus Staskawiczbacteria bacterium]
MKTNNKNYIILSVFAVIALLLIVFLIFPPFSEIERNSKALISAKKDMAGLDAQINEVENFKKNYENYEPNLKKIDQLFVDPANPVDFIKFLEDAASASQITSQISMPPYSQNSQQEPTSSKKSKPKVMDSIIFQFSSKGSFSGALNFAKKIESGPYLIEIENLTIQNSTDNSTGKTQDKNVLSDYSSRKVEATFTIKVFTK